MCLRISDFSVFVNVSPLQALLESQLWRNKSFVFCFSWGAFLFLILLWGTCWQSEGVELARLYLFACVFIRCSVFSLFLKMPSRKASNYSLFLTTDLEHLKHNWHLLEVEIVQEGLKDSTFLLSNKQVFTLWRLNPNGTCLTDYGGVPVISRKTVWPKI